MQVDHDDDGGPALGVRRLGRPGSIARPSMAGRATEPENGGLNAIGNAKSPVNAFTSLLELAPFCTLFRPQPYGSEHPGPRPPPPLHAQQNVPLTATPAFFSHD